MDVIFHPSHGENTDVEFFTNSGCVGPHLGAEFIWHEFVAVFGAEYNVNDVLGVCVGHVSHLRRLITLYTIYPELTHWANLCRAYGAGKGRPTPPGDRGQARKRPLHKHRAGWASPSPTEKSGP